MAGYAKSSRRLRQHRPGAVAELKHAAALAAVKVMMVRFARNLIARRLAGQRNRIEPALCQKRLDIAIDRGNAQRLVMALRNAQRLLWRKRTVCFDEGLADGLLLACVAGNRLRHTD